jgi:pSer/pThr/pTyr-binding forkhead associated (FHA) protein
VGSVTVVGRGDEADIVVDDPGVSRRHAEIRVTADGPRLQATLRDLGSTNGTLVAGRKVQSEHLGDGTTITVGRTHATYRSGER